MFNLLIFLTVIFFIYIFNSDQIENFKDNNEFHIKLKNDDKYLNVNLNKRDNFFFLTEDIETAHKFTLGGNRGDSLFYNNNCLEFDGKKSIINLGSDIYCGGGKSKYGVIYSGGRIYGSSRKPLYLNEDLKWTSDKIDALRFETIKKKPENKVKIYFNKEYYIKLIDETMDEKYLNFNINNKDEQFYFSDKENAQKFKDINGKIGYKGNCLTYSRQENINTNVCSTKYKPRLSINFTKSGQLSARYFNEKYFLQKSLFWGKDKNNALKFEIVYS